MQEHELTASDLLPAQWRALHNSSNLTPEKRLALAVLENAINLYSRGEPQTGTIHRNAYREAVGWLFCPTAGVFSFDAVCAMFDIDPEYLRGGLRRLTGKIPKRSPVVGDGMKARPSVSRERAVDNKKRYPRRSGVGAGRAKI